MKQIDERVVIPPRATALPDAFCAGCAIGFFSQLTIGAAEYSQVAVWVFGVLTLAAFAFAVYAGFTVRRYWPWRWWVSLVFCAAVLVWLALVNTDWSRFVVFLAVFPYGYLVYRQLQKGYATAPDPVADQTGPEVVSN